MGKKDDKTNVMRMLDALDLSYGAYSYDPATVDASGVAEALREDPAAVFKTLVAVGRSRAHYVFMLPSARSLDLKKAAAVTGEKSVEMIPQKELLPLTGYVHGGCSPLGMKKPFPVYVDASVLCQIRVYFSAGRVGRQVSLTPEELLRATAAQTAALAKED